MVETMRLVATVMVIVIGTAWMIICFHAANRCAKSYGNVVGDLGWTVVGVVGAMMTTLALIKISFG